MVRVCCEVISGAPTTSQGCGIEWNRKDNDHSSSSAEIHISECLSLGLAKNF